ncbi:hypothetical protein [Roseomonas sp. USHLN139]|uniref:hypothetical protein n=1 Tax=Roseomonas sp. USHLN139 TaxID=3081298 RepID=UPI003B023A7D
MSKPFWVNVYQRPDGSQFTASPWPSRRQARLAAIDTGPNRLACRVKVTPRPKRDPYAAVVDALCSPAGIAPTRQTSMSPALAAPYGRGGRA